MEARPFYENMSVHKNILPVEKLSILIDKYP